MTPTAFSERERMLRGDSYNSRDPELLALAHRARALLAEFRTLPSTDAAARQRTLSALLGDVGDGVWVESPFVCDYGAHISIGTNTFVNVDCVFLDSATISIGANVLIGPKVQLLTVTHPLMLADRIVPDATRSAGEAPYRTYARPITIHDNAWIGAGSIVLPGVTIGNGAVIGAGSVVTRDVPAATLSLGAPSRVVRAL